MNLHFNHIFKADKALSAGVAASLLLVAFLVLYANRFIGTKLQQVVGEHQGTIVTIYREKAISIIILSALQIACVVLYGLFGNVPTAPPQL